LHGIPWGAKDLLDTAGVPTTWGAEPFRNRVPETDAIVVRRLDDAGAVLAAKLTTGALAYGDIWFDGRTHNPWNQDEGASGSSAGPAAAVAAGLAGFAVGTETLGSIVSPSMRCGTTGLRPTFGRVARTGCMSLCWSLDKIGPVTRFVEDSALVLGAIHGTDPGDPASWAAPFVFDARAPLPKLRVGYVPTWFEGEDATSIDREALAAMKRLDVDVVIIETPELPYDALLAILFAEAATAFEALTLNNEDDTLTWQGADAWPNMFRLARFIPAVDYLAAQRLRREVMVAFAEVFADVDAIIGPSYAASMLVATNFTGHPSLTLRAGFRERPPKPYLDGKTAQDATPRTVPQGITVWGRLFEEGMLCRLGMALEQQLGVADQRPPLR
jgi:Asp-tRNA(Asn)/Glu-tRNA(Gln) amidotransferase A subunit family amidase